MKKPSKQVRSSILNALMIVGTIAIVFFLGAKNGDIGESMSAILSADFRWLLFALLAWALNVVLEASVNQVFFHQQKVNIRFFATLHITLIGQFYSSVTPMATGGQPMQVYAFKKRGVPAGISSSALAVKFFCFQTAVLILGVALWVFQADFINASIAGAKWLVWAGFFINGVTVAAVILLAINRNIVRFIIVLLLKIGKALRIVKDLPRASSHAEAALEDFRASVYMVTHHPVQILVLLLISFAQVACLMSVVYCVYRALGLFGAQYVQLMALQLLLFIGAAFSPLPGASGAQEGGFAIIFSGVIPGSDLLAALLLWRFCTYYIALIVGVVPVIVESVINIRRNKKQAAIVVPPKAQEGEKDE